MRPRRHVLPLGAAGRLGSRPTRWSPDAERAAGRPDRRAAGPGRPGARAGLHRGRPGHREHAHRGARRARQHRALQPRGREGQRSAGRGRAGCAGLGRLRGRARRPAPRPARCPQPRACAAPVRRGGRVGGPRRSAAHGRLVVRLPRRGRSRPAHGDDRHRRDRRAARAAAGRPGPRRHHRYVDHRHQPRRHHHVLQPRRGAAAGLDRRGGRGQGDARDLPRPGRDGRPQRGAGARLHLRGARGRRRAGPQAGEAGLEVHPQGRPQDHHVADHQPDDQPVRTGRGLPRGRRGRHRAAPRRGHAPGGAVQGAGGRGAAQRGRPGQDRLRVDRQPRAAHADHQRAGLHPDADARHRRRPQRAAGAAARPRREQRPAAAGPHRGPAHPVPDRGGHLLAPGRRGRPAPGGAAQQRGDRGDAAPPPPRVGRRAGRRTRRGVRRRGPARPGADQPGHQRREVHRGPRPGPAARWPPSAGPPC